ncbi:hypothetical protein SMSP2_02231 [Limihaloglobus sulfuriphilus]|uniref:Uncharacterized protein n=1 Tax=Limihaloglobus sulfuriphilus TaxID=1851148 RepID=A0A1Q2MHW8_9BACT|nr:hypothetical protein [Limihaloglobus sulfuriphilus]AQQ71852.1 hypothetical protein SMSP2_02231 [Limihaloglobus sulfuriphilus]
MSLTAAGPCWDLAGFEKVKDETAGTSIQCLWGTRIMLLPVSPPSEQPAFDEQHPWSAGFIADPPSYP